MLVLKQPGEWVGGGAGLFDLEHDFSWQGIVNDSVNESDRGQAERAEDQEKPHGLNLAVASFWGITVL